jgi:hypothetical protein
VIDPPLFAERCLVLDSHANRLDMITHNQFGNITHTVTGATCREGALLLFSSAQHQFPWPAKAWAAIDDVSLGHAGCKLFLQAELVAYGVSDAADHDVACFVAAPEPGSPGIESCGIPRCRYTLHPHCISVANALPERHPSSVETQSVGRADASAVRCPTATAPCPTTGCR